ncbi:MAG: gamma-glutamyltransferase, partial [Bacteroidales bacterium]|nr:gamma-glutamyltransferase [Bacteroidales bacterium]
MKNNYLKLLRLSLIFFLITGCFWVNELAFGQIRTSGLVATPDSHATQIANQILSQGGNAVDAGVAAIFALTVVQPYSSSLGGGGFMIVRLNNGKAPKVIDFREQAPLSTDPFIYYQNQDDFDFHSSSGYRSICIPGMLAGAARALEVYGTMKFEQILKPIIQLAENGFPISESLSKLTIKYYDLLESDRKTSAIFFPEWVPMNTGQLMKRNDLVLIFNLIAANGAQAFYRDEIADMIAKEMFRNNGLIRLPDLIDYKAIIRPVVKGNYKNITILSVPPPSSGGVALIELLKILENYDLDKFELNSGPYIRLFVEALKQVFKDRSQHLLGDPEFASLNYKSIILKENITKALNQIDSNVVGSNDGLFVPQTENRNAAHISIIDRDSNVVSISQTINTFFGSGISLENYGILFNNAMNNFSRDSSSSNALKPGRRPQSTLAPTIILRDNKPFLVIGTSGAERIIPILAQVIINFVDFKLSLQEAIQAPRFHYNY